MAIGFVLLHYMISLDFFNKCRKTKTKPITYQLDYSNNHRLNRRKNQNQSNCLITFDTHAIENQCKKTRPRHFFIQCGVKPKQS